MYRAANVDDDVAEQLFIRVIVSCLVGRGGLTLARVEVNEGDTIVSYNYVLLGATWLLHIQSKNSGFEGGSKGGKNDIHSGFT